jgi:hypothetical protein
VTGSDIDGDYLHPSLTFPFCIPCHDGMHAILRGAGIDGDREGTPLLVMARACAWLSWMAEEPGPYGITQEFAEQLVIALEEPLAALMAVRCG